MTKLSKNIITTLNEVRRIKDRLKLINHEFIITQGIYLVIVRLIQLIQKLRLGCANPLGAIFEILFEQGTISFNFEIS
ncbi:hypothetical protein D3C78_1866420 [compost metagenome]